METNEIISNIIRLYDSVKPSNVDPNTYTVLSALSNFKTGQLLALASGTQASLRVFTNDIEDCHAESLLKRAYKRYLLDRLLYLTETIGCSQNIPDIVRHECQHQDLSLFISQLPCGFIKRYEGREPVDALTGRIIERKPGRGQSNGSETIYVTRQSCFSKLKRWIQDGIQGSELKKLYSTKSRIKEILIGDCEPVDDLDYSNLTDSLVDHLPSAEPLICKQVSIRRNDLVFSASKRPQPIALVWWASSTGNENGSIEYIVDGRKMGLTKKHCLAPRDNHSLKISDQYLRADLLRLQHRIGLK